MISSAKVRQRFAMAISIFCLSPAASQAADDAGRISTVVDRAVDAVMGEHDVPGIAVAVTVNGERYFFNYGVASKESNTPVTEHTLFEIGSISKTFTATLATYAQTLGKISLHDHPGIHMPSLRGSAIDKVELLHLGTYTAGGLPLQFPDATTNHTGMTDYFRQWTPVAAPGELRQYSNPSIGLLGHITSLAMSGEFVDLVEAELLPRLGLSHSYIQVPEEEMDNYAWGYNEANTAIRLNPGLLDGEAYGVKSTSADMIRFVEANIRPELLETPIQRALEGTQVAYFKVGEMLQGLGWEQYPYPVTLDRLLAGNSRAMALQANTATPLTPPRRFSEPMLFNKTGSTNGFGAYVAYVPVKKIGIVVLANKNFPIPARITAAHAVLEQLSLELP